MPVHPGHGAVYRLACPAFPEALGLWERSLGQDRGSIARWRRSHRGGIYLPSTLWQVLQKARAAALPPALVESPLAHRPYDFRHAGISWRLNAGAPGPQVAEWAGHSVEVLYRIYAHCIGGDDERWYARMEELLG